MTASEFNRTVCSLLERQSSILDRQSEIIKDVIAAAYSGSSTDAARMVRGKLDQCAADSLKVRGMLDELRAAFGVRDDSPGLG